MNDKEFDARTEYADIPIWALDYIDDLRSEIDELKRTIERLKLDNETLTSDQ
jgi:hypothetical protein